jgi:DNA-binding MarR family transcriptional regulator
VGSALGVETDLGWALGVITRSYLRAVREAVSGLPGGVRGYLVLAVASQDEPKSQLALAQHLGVDRTVMTYLLDDLEGEGLVERRPDPADRRARHVTLTSSGQAQLAELKAGLLRVEDLLLDPLPVDDRAVLRDLLQRLATALSAATDRDASPCDPEPCAVAEELVDVTPPTGLRRRRRHAVRARPRLV